MGGADSREFLKQVFFFKGLRGKNCRKKKKGLIVRRMRGWPAAEKCCIVGGSSHTNWNSLARRSTECLYLEGKVKRVRAVKVYLEMETWLH